MTRAPVPGETKTRLQAAIGRENASKLAESFFLDCLERVSRLPQFHPMVLVAGDLEHALFSELSVPRSAQVGVDLGARIEHALITGLQKHHSAVVIGSDSPSLPIAYLARAHDLLQQPAGRKHAVLGPAADGGFYLIGATSWKRGTLHDVGWSEPTTCAQTLRALKNAGFETSFLPPWYDVDDPAALSLLRAHLARRPKAAPKTASLLKSSLFSW